MAVEMAPSLLALRLVEGRYEIVAGSSGAFRTDWPFPVELTVADLAQ